MGNANRIQGEGVGVVVPANQINVEFVGGPIDGQIRTLPDEPNALTIKELKKGEIVEHVYIRRKINGINVRLPSGLFPFDWKPS